MSCSVDIQPAGTLANDPWGSAYGLWPADDQLGSMPSNFSTWDFELSQDLYNPDLILDASHDPEPSPKNDIGCQLSKSLSALPVPSNGQPKNRKHRDAKPARSGVQKNSSRERFLERNRQAASRCRQKRKEHTNLLEARYEDQSTKHQQLQSEFRCLRSEILGLKNEVLKHAHCTDSRISDYLSQMLEKVHNHGQEDRTTSLSASSEIDSAESPDEPLPRTELDDFLVAE